MSQRDIFSDTPQTGDLFAEVRTDAPEVEGEWPPAERFPLNVAGRSVRKRVVADLVRADSPLVVTGYASLEQLIRLEDKLDDGGAFRILFGNEPSVGVAEQRSLKPPSLPEEVEQYWLDRGISLRLSARLVQFRERLRVKPLKSWTLTCTNFTPRWPARPDALRAPGPTSDGRDAGAANIG